MARRKIQPTHLYFAYGSNTNPQQMAHRAPVAQYIGNAKLYEHSICFAGYSGGWGGAVATLDVVPGSSTVGALYKLTDEDLEAMDAFEGTDYERLLLPMVHNGEIVRAWTYVLKHPVRFHPPSDQYVWTIRDGYRARGISSNDLDEALVGTFPVFVYGSLKQGFGNHRLLKSSTLVGKAETVERSFQMYSLGAFPGVVWSDRNVATVKGELYRVDSDTLDNLDRLEGHPTFYRRYVVSVRQPTGVLSAAYIYLLNNDRSVSHQTKVPRNNWTQAHACSYSSLSG